MAKSERRSKTSNRESISHIAVRLWGIRRRKDKGRQIGGTKGARVNEWVRGGRQRERYI